MKQEKGIVWPLRASHFLRPGTLLPLVLLSAGVTLGTHLCCCSCWSFL